MAAIYYVFTILLILIFAIIITKQIKFLSKGNKSSCNEQETIARLDAVIDNSIYKYDSMLSTIDGNIMSDKFKKEIAKYAMYINTDIMCDMPTELYKNLVLLYGIPKADQVIKNRIIYAVTNYIMTSIESKL